MTSAERGARQLAVGTWVLAAATIGLLVATIVLAVITARAWPRHLGPRGSRGVRKLGKGDIRDTLRSR